MQNGNRFRDGSMMKVRASLLDSAEVSTERFIREDMNS